MNKEKADEIRDKLVEQNKSNVSNEKEMIEAYIQENNLMVETTGTGLRYTFTEKGEGKRAENGMTVSVHYIGKFMDGRVFDSSVERGTPFEFALGQGQVIKGWDEGLGLMNVGDKATFIIPSHLAYGANGAGDVIPPNATIIFDVELLAVE